MSEEHISVRQWQERFRAGAYQDKSFATQCEAGWYDWFCKTEALAGRLKKISSVVMGITDPYILDNYYVWFKNNCPMVGPLYDDVRFEPLSGDRDGKYFVVCLDSPHENKRWALITERYDFGAPEFECDNVRDMAKYINAMARELDQGVVPHFVTERQAVAQFALLHEGTDQVRVHREDNHSYSYSSPRDRQTKTVSVSSGKDSVPEGYSAEQGERIGGLYVFSQEGPLPTISLPEKQPAPKRKEQER